VPFIAGISLRHGLSMTCSRGPRQWSQVSFSTRSRYLDERQKAYAADKLIGFAENANAYTVRYIAEALEHVASQPHVDKMAALIAGDDVDKYAKTSMGAAIQKAKRRR
jgi:hypothetical protein